MQECSAGDECSAGEGVQQARECSAGEGVQQARDCSAWTNTRCSPPTSSKGACPPTHGFSMRGREGGAGRQGGWGGRWRQISELTSLKHGYISLWPYPATASLQFPVMFVLSCRVLNGR